MCNENEATLAYPCTEELDFNDEAWDPTVPFIDDPQDNSYST